MKSVLISIQPKWCELIASGKKTVEVRKTRPKLETPFKVYIYCTQNNDGKIGHWLNLYCDSKFVTTDIHLEELCYKLNGKVIGEFVCDSVKMSFVGYNEKGCPSYWDILDGSCLTPNELVCYGEWKTLYGWHISNLVIYDKPKELSEFKRFCDGISGNIGCRGCKYYCEENDESQGHFEMCGCDNLRPLTRPPQSWCYVEEGGVEE